MKCSVKVSVKIYVKFSCQQNLKKFCITVRHSLVSCSRFFYTECGALRCVTVYRKTATHRTAPHRTAPRRIRCERIFQSRRPLRMHYAKVVSLSSSVSKPTKVIIIFSFFFSSFYFSFFQLYIVCLLLLPLVMNRDYH